jgi:hypothetical protein
MSQSLQIIDELEVALKSCSPDRHNAILKSVTGPFLAGSDRINEEIASVFDDVIVRLIDHVESRARVELSMDLAPIATAPNHVFRRLAADDDASTKLAGGNRVVCRISRNCRSLINDRTAIF